MHHEDPDTRLTLLERRVRHLTTSAVAGGAAFLTLAALLAAGVLPGDRAPDPAGPAAGGDGSTPGDVLTVRGVAVVDETGRPRVLIGAPISAVTDDPRPAATSGVVVLDSLGRPAVALGMDPPLIRPDGTVAERVASSSGLTIYDQRNGMERGGMGAFADGRANLCLDYEGRQKEAICMHVAPGDESASVLINGTPGEDAFDRVGMFVGADGVGVLKAFGGGQSKDGVLILAGQGRASIAAYDSIQAPIVDLLER